MANVTLYTTEYGSQLLAKSGWVDSLKYWSLADFGRNYVVTAEQTIIPSVAGSDGGSNKTSVFCGVPSYKGMLTNPTTQEIQNLIRDGIAYYNKEDCLDEFKDPNLAVNFHVQRWINELRNAINNGYSYTMNEKVSKNIYDYISLTIREKNFNTGTYDDLINTTSFGISYVPKSTQDLTNYKSVSPIYVDVEGATKKVYSGFGDVRYSSPLRLGFTTSVIGGRDINGTNLIISLQPDYWGYNTDLGFITDLVSVESNPDTYSYIYPAVNIGGTVFSMNSNKIYNTKSNDQIGFFMNLFNTDGKSALEELLDRMYLYFKTNAKPVDGKYYLTLNFDARLTGREINDLEIFGNNLIINFVLDVNDTTLPTSDAEIIEIL